MSGEYLFDTNIVIALFGGTEEIVKQLTPDKIMYLPSVALGELWYGVERSAHRSENTIRLERFAQEFHVLNCDTEVAREYGVIRNELKLKGKPIPINDVWIAATARHHALTLVTRDDHFTNIDRLTVTRW